MRFLLLIFSLVLISTDVTSNPSGADDEDIMASFYDEDLMDIPTHLYRINDIYSQSGNEVITDIKINSSVDDFGDEVETETKKIYFLVDGEGVEEEVEITKIRCAFYYAKTNSYASFPFDLRLKFKKDLDYTHAKYPTILIQYKLPNGDKGYYEHEQFSARSSKNPLVTLEGNKIYRLVDMERLYNEEYPYFKPIELMWDELTKDSSSNNGEIKLVFPTRSGSNILVSFNPFHESWLELYLDKCRDTDEAAKKLEYVMGSFLTEETSKAMDFDEF